MNESIQSIHQIIKFTKEELEANLASTQTLFAESIKGKQRLNGNQFKLGFFFFL